MLFEKIELEPNEQVLRVVRKHWFVIVAELFGGIIFGLVPIFIIIVMLLIPNLPINITDYTNYLIYGLSGWLLITTLGLFMTWTHYYLDLWIITDRRIIVIDQIHFFNRKVSIFRLERMQDIKVSVNGVLATFLNFGTLRAQTASAAESNFMTTGLPDPRELQSLIQKAMDERLKELGRQSLID